MDGWMKSLVAVACLAVIGAAGWYGYSEWRAAQDRAAEAAAVANEDDARIRRDHEANQAECATQIDEWDAGGREPLERELGIYAEELIDHCRWLLSVGVE